MAKSKKPKPSAGQRAAAEQQWAQLEAALDEEMKILGPSRLEVGHILYDMKRWLKQWGFLKGRRFKSPLSDCFHRLLTKHRLSL